MPERTDELYLDWATYAAAKHAVLNWHYSRCMPAGKLVKVGVWEKGKFKGVVVFGLGAQHKLVAQYGLEPTQGCELVRVALDKHDVPVSRIVSLAVRMLKRYCPKLKLIVSFADPEQGHVGGIYQAMGWIYNGKSGDAKYYVYKGRRYHPRSFMSKYSGKGNSEGVTKIKLFGKHRYLLPLDKRTAAEIRKLSLPYPKRQKRAMAGVHPAQRGFDTYPDAPTASASNA